MVFVRLEFPQRKEGKEEGKNNIRTRVEGEELGIIMWLFCYCSRCAI